MFYNGFGSVSHCRKTTHPSHQSKRNLEIECQRRRPTLWRPESHHHRRHVAISTSESYRHVSKSFPQNFQFSSASPAKIFLVPRHHWHCTSVWTDQRTTLLRPMAKLCPQTSTARYDVPWSVVLLTWLSNGAPRIMEFWNPNVWVREPNLWDISKNMDRRSKQQQRNSNLGRPCRPWMRSVQGGTVATLLGGAGSKRQEIYHATIRAWLERRKIRGRKSSGQMGGGHKTTDLTLGDCRRHAPFSTRHRQHRRIPCPSRKLAATPRPIHRWPSWFVSITAGHADTHHPNPARTKTFRII